MASPSLTPSTSSTLRRTRTVTGRGVPDRRRALAALPRWRRTGPARPEPGGSARRPLGPGAPAGGPDRPGGHPGRLRLGPRAPTPHLSGASFSETWSTGHLPDGGGPIALSSPVPVNLDGQPSVVVGDRLGNLFAFHLGGSSAELAATGVADHQRERPHRLDAVGGHLGGPDLGAGRIGQRRRPGPGGYSGLQRRRAASCGSPRWSIHPATPPRSAASRPASPSEPCSPADRTPWPARWARSPTPSTPRNGAPLTGWPFLNTDSTHSTAALADLYGIGHRPRSSWAATRRPAKGPASSTPTAATSGS